jgi:hypothetical protein
MLDAQLATAVDCEGYIGIYRSYDKRRNTFRYSPRISVGMTDPVIPEKFKERFGSTVYVYPSRKGFKTCYNWVIQNKIEVRSVLNFLIPYLLVKHSQAENVLAFIDYCDAHPMRYGQGAKRFTDGDILMSFWNKAKELNHSEPATTKRRDPVTGSNSLNSCENMREESEVVLPVSK